MQEEEKKKKINKIVKTVNIALSVILAVFLCFLAVKIFFVTSITVNQTSMYPTYKEGEKVYVSRLGNIERGMVAVYFDGDVAAPRLASSFSVFKDSNVNLLIKRIVALDGDEIWLEYASGGYILKIRCAGDGNTIEEEYADGNGEKIELKPITLNPDTAGVLYDATQWDPYVVGEECAFMIGDNRPESLDSRIFGDVPFSHIVGIAIN